MRKAVTFPVAPGRRLRSASSLFLCCSSVTKGCQVTSVFSVDGGGTPSKDDCCAAHSCFCKLGIRLFFPRKRSVNLFWAFGGNRGYNESFMRALLLLLLLRVTNRNHRFWTPTVKDEEFDRRSPVNPDTTSSSHS